MKTVEDILKIRVKNEKGQYSMYDDKSYYLSFPKEGEIEIFMNETDIVLFDLLQKYAHIKGFAQDMEKILAIHADEIHTQYAEDAAGEDL